MRAADDRLRVVMIIIDAMPHRYVSAELTPHLWHQAQAGSWMREGGVSVPMSVTYANHAAFITGADPRDTGVFGNHTWIDGEGWVKAPPAGPRATTLFDRVADTGGRSVIVVGDHKLIAQMGGGRADESWPPDGWFPEGTPRCPFGYATDAAVVAAADAVDLDADLVVLHLNEPDTTSHMYGPDSPEAIEQYRATDAAYGRLIELLADDWEHTVLITLSDHDQETITEQSPVALLDALTPFEEIHAIADGTAALLHGPTDEALAAALDVEGIESVEQLDDDVWMAWTTPGRMLTAAPIELRGQHGSPRCRTQLAIVSGGDARRDVILKHLGDEQPSALSWAPIIADLLELDSLPSVGTTSPS